MENRSLVPSQLGNSMNIIPLGIGGFIPAVGRETACVLCIEQNTAILFDAGTGVRHLALPSIQKLLQPIDTLHVILSHLHLDHLSGFIWLHGICHSSIEVYVPSVPLVTSHGEEALFSLIGPPFFSLPLLKWPNYGGIHPITESHIRVANLRVDILSQAHKGGSLGYRIHNFAYITDADPDDRHVQFLRDCDLVFMDTYHDQYDRTLLNQERYKGMSHGHSVGNAVIAQKAKVRRLGLIHINPFYDDQRVSTLLHEARQYFRNSFIPIEKTLYSIKD